MMRAFINIDETKRGRRYQFDDSAKLVATVLNTPSADMPYGGYARGAFLIAYPAAPQENDAGYDMIFTVLRRDGAMRYCRGFIDTLLGLTRFSMIIDIARST